MESYYDSDEEIAWGPLTLREIKKELGKQPKNINRRESDFGSYSSLETKSNSSGTSVYFTPNETLHQPDANINKNAVFLEKITQVIEGENNTKMETSYETALDISKVKPVNDTLLKILNSEERYSHNLDNIEQTLVENTVQYSPYDNNRVMQHNSAIIEVTDESDTSEDDIIVITDDSSDESIEHIYEPVEHLIKEENLSDESRLPETEESSDEIAYLEQELKNIREKQKILRSGWLDSSKEESEDDCHEKSLGNVEDISRNGTYAINKSVESEEGGSMCEESAQFEDKEDSYLGSQEYEGNCVEDMDSHDIIQHKNNSINEMSKTEYLSFIGDVNNLPTLNTVDEDRLLNSTTNLNESSQSRNFPTLNTADEHKLLDSTTSANESSEPRTENDNSSQPLDLRIEEEEDNFNEKFQRMDLNVSGIGRLSINQSINQPNPVAKNPSPSLASYESESTDSGNKSESFNFNDTLEELQKFCKQGTNYINSYSSEDSREQTSIHEEPVTVKKATGTIKKRQLKTPKKFDYIQSPIGEYIKKTPVADFKYPLKPPVKPILTPNLRSPQIQQPKPFKNIVSPIGIYIKNNPGVCSKQNVPVKTVASLKYAGQGEAIKSNKENICSELPQVIYKPAKKVVSSVKKDDNIVLPSNIQKLVPERMVTKHETRVKTVINNSVVGKKLLEEDLTTTTVDGSLLGDDISFVTVQQAFIK